MNKKNRFYVVWKGRKTGVFDSWELCKAQIDKFPGALHKSFSTQALAEAAFRKNDLTYQVTTKPHAISLIEKKSINQQPIAMSIAVDGAWNVETGIAEYQGVETHSKKCLFRMGPFEDGTNNIVEFLAIVHALAYTKKHSLFLPIYSDSRTAIKWVKDKKANTKHTPSDRNKPLFELIEKAITWLNTHHYTNPILKWETQLWGENPADFGRK